MEVGWFVGGGNKCKFYGGGGGGCVIGRPTGLCGSCVIRVTSTHDIKSIGMFEDDVT